MSCPAAQSPGTGVLAAKLELSGEWKKLPLTSLSTAPQSKPLFLPALKLFSLLCFKCCTGTSGEGLEVLSWDPSHGVQSQHLQSRSESLERG